MNENNSPTNLDEFAELLKTIAGEAGEALQQAISTFISSLIYLHDDNWFVGFKVEVPEPDKVLWVFDVMDSDRNIKVHYVVEDIIECMSHAKVNIDGLLGNNPGFKDKPYLIGVGVEQALRQYQQPTS